MMPIVFCASFEPWAEGHVRRGDHLEPPESEVEALRRRAPEHVEQHDHEQEADDDAEDGRRDERHEHLPEHAVPLDRVRAGGHQGRAEQAADQRVAARARDAEPPRDEVPRDRTEQRRGDDDQVRVRRLDQPRADRLGDRGPGQRASEVRRGRQQDRVLGFEGPGGDRRGDRIRGVVEAVDEVEDHREREHHDQQERHAFEHRAEA